VKLRQNRMHHLQNLRGAEDLMGYRIYITKMRCKGLFFKVYGNYGEDMFNYDLVEFEPQPQLFRSLKFIRKFFR
jgi:hypothetical protein